MEGTVDESSNLSLLILPLLDIHVLAFTSLVKSFAIAAISIKLAENLVSRLTSYMTLTLCFVVVTQSFVRRLGAFSLLGLLLLLEGDVAQQNVDILGRNFAISIKIIPKSDKISKVKALNMCVLNTYRLKVSCIFCSRLLA